MSSNSNVSNERIKIPLFRTDEPTAKRTGEAEVNATVIDGLFAVHKNINKDTEDENGGGWTVTHMLTKLSIIKKVNTRSDAMRISRELSKDGQREPFEFDEVEEILENCPKWLVSWIEDCYNNKGYQPVSKHKPKTGGKKKCKVYKSSSQSSKKTQ